MIMITEKMLVYVFFQTGPWPNYFKQCENEKKRYNVPPINMSTICAVRFSKVTVHSNGYSDHGLGLWHGDLAGSRDQPNHSPHCI